MMISKQTRLSDEMSLYLISQYEANKFLLLT